MPVDRQSRIHGILGSGARSGCCHFSVCVMENP